MKMETKFPEILEEVDNEELEMECSICCEKITFSTVCPVSCGHILHRTCFNEYFKSKVEVKNFPIMCPEEKCYQDISISDIQEYIDRPTKEKYFEFSLHAFVEENSKNINWCRTPGCTAIY